MLEPQFQNTRQGYVKVLDRKEDELSRFVSKTFILFERCRKMREHNSIALGVAISSSRAKELLEKLHEEVFPTFIPPEPKLQENGEWVWWFCYSEPGIPMHYVSASQELR
jgi:hypothetical protein